MRCDKEKLCRNLARLKPKRAVLVFTRGCFCFISQHCNVVVQATARVSSACLLQLCEKRLFSDSSVSYAFVDMLLVSLHANIGSRPAVSGRPSLIPTPLLLSWGRWGSVLRLSIGSF